MYNAVKMHKNSHTGRNIILISVKMKVNISARNSPEVLYFYSGSQSSSSDHAVEL